MKKIISLFITLSMLVMLIPQVMADDVDDAFVERDTATAVNEGDFSDYLILEGEQLFFEDFEGEKIDPAYLPSNEFSIRKDSKGSNALYINATSKNIATNRFGPELKNFLVEADVMLAGCNAGSNGGLFISGRKTSNSSPSYNMLYTEINNYNWETKTYNSKTATRDRLLITRSRGSFNIGSSWFWTAMGDSTGALDLSSRSFSDYVHMKMYMSDTFIRIEMYTSEGELLSRVEQSTDMVDTIAGGGSPMARIEKGNIQLGVHGCVVWYDNVSVREISVMNKAEIKTSAKVMLVGDTYDIYAQTERGEMIPFGMLTWEYDAEKLDIADGKVVAKEAGEFEVKAIYGGQTASYTIKAQKEYAFSDYEIIVDRPNVFLGEKIEFYLTGMYEGDEYRVIRNIDTKTGAGSYDGMSVATTTPGNHTLTVTYNGITKSTPVYVSPYSAAQIVPESASIDVEASTAFAVMATLNGNTERVTPDRYKLTLQDGLVSSGEVVTAEKTGERKLYAEFDNVKIETALDVKQKLSGTVINENFEDNWYSEFFTVPAEDIVTDVDGNKVYKLTDEFSPFYGDLSWRNYKVRGRVKILNDRIEDNRYNTSFSIYYRQQIPSDPEMTGGQYGLPAVYCLDKEHQYLRIGSQSGQDLKTDKNVWYDFELETNGDQQIFRLGESEICFVVSVKESGGFVFNAENTEIYLDDIVVERMDDNATGEIVSIEAVNSGVPMDVFANRQITSLIAVKAIDSQGRYKYVSEKAEYEVLSGNAEIVSETFMLKIDENTTENVKLGIKYEGKYCEAQIVPIKNHENRTQYLKSTQDIRNKNFCYKILRNASSLGVLNSSQLSYATYVTSLLALQPKKRSYDTELNWLVGLGKQESSTAGVSSNVDFVVNILIVLRNEVKDFLNASDEAWANVDELLLGEYYGSDKTMISENHRIVNLTDAYLIGEMFPDAIMYGGKTGRETSEEYKQYILNWMNFRYKYGMTEYDSTYTGIDLIALETVSNYAKDEGMRRLCNDFLTWLYTDSVIDSMGDRLTGAHGRTYFNTDTLAKMFHHAQRFEIEDTKWMENVGAYGVQPAIYSFLKAELDDVAYEIASADKTGLVNKERRKTHHLPDDEDVEELCKYTYFGDGYALGCIVNYDNPFHDVTYKGDKYYNSKGIWVAGGHQELSMTATIRGNDKRFLTFGQPGPAGPSDTKSKHHYFSGFYNYPAFDYMQHENTIVGIYHINDIAQLPYSHGYIPKSQFERVDEEDGWIFLLSDDIYTAIKPVNASKPNGAAYRWGDEVKHTGSNILLSENEICMDGEHTGFVLQMVSKNEINMSFDEFKSAMKQTKIKYSKDNNGTLEYTTYKGDVLKMVYDTHEDSLNGVKENYSQWKLFDSKYTQSEYGSGYTTISTDNNTFTVMPARLVGDKDSIYKLDTEIANIPVKMKRNLYTNADVAFDKLNIDIIAENIIYMPNEYVAGILWEKLIATVDEVVSKKKINAASTVNRLQKYLGIDFHDEYVEKLINAMEE